ncbi:unnamed protein product [Heterobilharzia americana]|nr:unnamed protein product [Heterobilharzia americana]
MVVVCINLISSIDAVNKQAHTLQRRLSYLVSMDFFILVMPVWLTGGIRKSSRGAGLLESLIPNTYCYLVKSELRTSLFSSILVPEQCYIAFLFACRYLSLHLAA